MRTLALLSTVLLGACSLYFDTDHSHSGAGGGGISDVDGGISIPPTQPPDDGGQAGSGVVDAGLGCGGPAGPALAAEAQWAACLTVSGAEFAQTNANSISLAQSADGRCYSCHSPGGAGQYYAGMGSDTLHAWSTQAYVDAVFEPRAVPGPNGTIVYQMGVADQKICDAGVQQADNSGTHPAYDCTAQVNGVDPLTALEQFRALVQAKLDAGECPAPGFATP